MSIRIERLSGRQLASGLPDVARLRIAVFRAWPYLYDGDLAYEEDYLADFARAGGAIIVAAYDGDDIVGAATGAPLMEHTPGFAALFASHGLPPESIFYCGESVLLERYRGQGIGHAFFDHREAHARALRDAASHPISHTAFCAVIRDADDPRCPPGYRPLDGFWQKRGYRRVDGMIGHYEWREIGETTETRKPMQFWARALAANPQEPRT